MDKEVKTGSVGRVETQLVRVALPAEGLKLESGEYLPELDIAFEAYGTLNAAKTNAIFICHALSGDAHVAGLHSDDAKSVGWWDGMVGPGKGIDTNYYYVICANILGGCKGTTGPSSINPKSGRPYGAQFPVITVGDIVNAHCELLKHLGIQKLAAVVGGSLGGMQVLEWAVRYPDMVDRCICIASATGLSAQALAFDIIGRRAITSDPDWNNGDYYEAGGNPTRGLAQARMIGHITYLSQEMMSRKFGRQRRENGTQEKLPKALDRFKSDFQVEGYLEHQGQKFVARFDANSYLHITRAIDEYDLEERFGSLEKALEPIRAKLLVVAMSEDWLFPPEESEELANAMMSVHKSVSYCQLVAPHGHDAFLIDIQNLSDLIRAFLPWVREESSVSAQDNSVPESCRVDYEIIHGMIKPGGRVLDLGCGDGSLLKYLSGRLGIKGMGIDIDLANIISVIDKGFDVFQGDIDNGLAMVPDLSYDYAVLSETMQVVKRPRDVLREMLRVAGEGIVSFPNFGKWSYRLQLLLSGRMPKGTGLPFEWYDTPNIHLFTLKDFKELCREDGIRILETVCVYDCGFGRLLKNVGLANLGADRVLVRIARGRK